MASGGDTRLEVEVLGPLRVRRAEELALDRPAHRRLLSILALAGGDRLSIDSLIDRLWGDPPATAKAALQTHVYSLRKILGDGAIKTEAHGYRLDLSAAGLDVVEFVALAEQAAAHARSGDWAAVTTAIDAALELWRGPPFVELRDDDFARAEIARLEETRLELLELGAEALLEAGRPEDALPDLEALVIEHPYRERLWEHLMTARYRLGRHTEALRAFQDVRAHLAEIGVEPGKRLRRLEEKILLHHESLQQTPNNLPPDLDEFIGRRREIEALSGMVESTSMVTLIGAGGSGKTRLAVEAARTLLQQFPDGVWFVELAALSDPADVPVAVARAVGLSSVGDDVIGSITNALQNSAALVILDNCEHVVAAAADVAHRLLSTASRDLRVLATSRAPLHITGEHVFEVPGMSVPGEGEDPVGEHDAIDLFLERAMQAGRTIDGARQMPAVVEICRRLDGMPLAIELAAARTRSLAPEVIAERLDDRFRLLTGGAATAPERHQTLEAALDWSYELLDPRQQAVLRRLGVFIGGFMADMAEAVAADDQVEATEVLDALVALVDTSLVDVIESPVGPRYRLLETVAQYADRRMGDDERTETEERFRLWADAFAEEWHHAVVYDGSDDSVPRLLVEAGNLNAAGATGPVSPLVTAVMAAYYDALGLVSAAPGLLESVLDELPMPTRLYWAAQHARMLYLADQEAASVAAQQAAVEMAVGQPASAEKAVVYRQLARGLLINVREDPGQAVQAAQEALAIAKETGAHYPQVQAQLELGFAMAWNGQPGFEVAHGALTLAHEVLPGGPDPYIYTRVLEAMYLDPKARRDGPYELAQEMEQRFPNSTDLDFVHWLPWTYLQAGEFGRAEEVVARFDGLKHEGSPRIWQLITRATLNWMRGRLDDAVAGVQAIWARDPSPRWYHDFLPLAAEVNADLGDLEAVRKAAEQFLATPVHGSEEANKLAVLDPLVRAEVDAALEAEDGADHAEAAANARARMGEIIADFPPRASGSIAMETPTTHLAFADAELSRLSGSDPELWRGAASRADYLYFRLYAQWRLGEALAQQEANEEAGAILKEARAAAAAPGADLLVRRMDATARRHGLRIT